MMRMSARGRRLILIAALAAFVLSSAAEAQEPQKRRRTRRPDTQATTTQATTGPTTTTATTTAATTTAGAEEKKPHYFAVTNAVVHTVTGPVLEGATVLCRDGKLVAIGREVRLPPECELLDARGWHVYPGLVAVSATGIHGAAPPEHTTDVFSLSMLSAAAGGITTALSGNEAVKLTPGAVDDMIVRKNVFFNLSYTTNNPLERRRLRKDLQRMRHYLRDLRRYEQVKDKEKDAKPPDKEWIKGRFEDYRKLLSGETTAIAAADRTQELRDLADLAQQFGFKLVVRGAFEGWLVADELGRAGVSAIVTPRTRVPLDERYSRPTGATIENAARLHRSGVTLAVVPAQTGVSPGGLGGRDLLHLNMEAAFAVRGGMTNDEALRTITIDAARVLGIDDRVGSLEVGKDADLIVCDGDILHYMTQVHYTVVNGRVAYDKSKETLFAHIRPEGKPEVPVFDDQWPRRLQWRQ